MARLDENSPSNMRKSACQKSGDFKQVEHGAIFVFDGKWAVKKHQKRDTLVWHKMGRRRYQTRLVDLGFYLARRAEGAKRLR